jgi:hypothetical protein
MAKFADRFFKVLEKENDKVFVEKIFERLNTEYIKLENCDYYSADLFKYIEVLQILLGGSVFIKDGFLRSCFPKQRQVGRNWQVSNMLGNYCLNLRLTVYFI